MAQVRNELIEEGDHDLYIREVGFYTGAKSTATKIALAFRPRGKRVAWLYLLHSEHARVWAVQLAEYCRENGLPWPSFGKTENIMNTLSALKRQKVQLRVRINHRTYEEIFYAVATLLRPAEDS